MSGRPRTQWTPKRAGLLLLVCAAGALVIASFFLDVPDGLITLPFAACLSVLVVRDYRRDPSPVNRRWLVVVCVAAAVMVLGTVLELAGV